MHGQHPKLYAMVFQTLGKVLVNCVLFVDGQEEPRRSARRTDRNGQQGVPF